jgi:protein-tyrosine-phosphatase
MAIRTKVLFLCSENSCRTQMAEAFLRDLTGDEFEIVSAGSEAGRLDPEAALAGRGYPEFSRTGQRLVRWDRETFPSLRIGIPCSPEHG